jgi:hypothetical protein
MELRHLDPRGVSGTKLTIGWAATEVSCVQVNGGWSLLKMACIHRLRTRVASTTSRSARTANPWSPRAAIRSHASGSSPSAIGRSLRGRRSSSAVHTPWPTTCSSSAPPPGVPDQEKLRPDKDRKHLGSRESTAHRRLSVRESSQQPSGWAHEARRMHAIPGIRCDWASEITGGAYATNGRAHASHQPRAAVRSG